MCEHCKQAVFAQAWDRLEEIGADAATNCWLTRCPVCWQLWETHAFQPQYSWELNLAEAKSKFPQGSFCGHSSIAMKPAWLTPTVKALAEEIFKERIFDWMPVLGDALEEAGCTDQDVLSHCRCGEEHCRGCWVLEVLLGKK